MPMASAKMFSMKCFINRMRASLILEETRGIFDPTIRSWKTNGVAKIQNKILIH